MHEFDLRELVRHQSGLMRIAVRAARAPGGGARINDRIGSYTGRTS
eukprot:SAG31_NODE_20033_length_585_cov_1.271605_2_plen_45_part_01